MVGGSVSAEREFPVAAAQVWNLYGNLKLSKVVQEALPNIFANIDVVQGDGTTGTILHLFFVPGVVAEGLASYKEKFTVVDDERRVKETEVVEGGYLNMGFTLYRVRLEVMEKQQSCVVRATIEYELNPHLDEKEAEAAKQLVSIHPLVRIMEISETYLLQN